MKNLNLKSTYEVVNFYCGKSKFDFWTNLEIGDIIEIKCILPRKNYYVPQVEVEVIKGKTVGTIFCTTNGQLYSYLDQMELKTLS